MDPVAISSWTSSLDPRNEAHLMTVRNAAKVFNPADVGGREKDFLISYQYVETAQENTVDYQNMLKETLLTDLKISGFQDIEVHEQHVWPYFQHWDLDGLNRRYPLRLMKMQGSRRTWFAGASTLFESVHDCMEYNLTLTSMIDRMRSATGES
jgi:hypothetical protein